MKESMKSIAGSKTPEKLRDHWRTPKVLFNRLDFEFEFDCDVAASKENHLCENYITQASDALSHRKFWGWSNFCNPPYSNIKPWIEKACRQNLIHRKTVLLAPSDTSVKWFSLALATANEIRFITDGRISFLYPGDGRRVAGNPKGSMLIIFKGYPNTGQAVISFMERPK